MNENNEKLKKYTCAIGRRKSAVAVVKIYEESDEKSFTINDKKLNNYWNNNKMLMEKISSPLKLFSLDNNKYKIVVKVKGGGLSGQADAIQLGISRILLKMDQNRKKQLKANGYLTRDPREVERKKPGLKKARRAPQWQKR